MMTCREAARLVSEIKDHSIPWHKRLGLRIHLMMCKLCSAYRDQLELISRLSERAGAFVMTRPGAGALSSDAKERIKQELSKPH